MNRRTFVASIVVAILATSSARTQPPAGGQPPLEQKQIKIMSLQNTPAEEAQNVLRQVFDEGKTNRGRASAYGANMPSSPPVQIAVHESTNSLILRGSADTLTVAEAIVQRLDERGTEKHQADSYADLRKRVSRLERQLHGSTARQSSSRTVPATRAKPATAPETAKPPAELRRNPTAQPESVKQSAETKTVPSTSARQPAPAGETAPNSVARQAVSSRNAVGTRIAAEVKPTGGKSMRVVRIAKPGTRVEKGDLLAELAITDLEDVINAERIPLEQSKAQLAQLQTEMQHADAEGQMAEAELLQRVELSELALTTYRKATAEIEIKQLESEVAKATRVVETIEGAIGELKDKRNFQLEDARRHVELAKLRHSAMVEVQVPAEITRLEGERKLAALALQLVRDKMANEKKRLEAQKIALAINIKLQEDKLARLEESKGGCVIEAPHDGFVDPRSRLLNIQRGAIVRHNQTLLILMPDSDSKK